MMPANAGRPMQCARKLANQTGRDLRELAFGT
jgi:hypothetical protein